MKSYLVKIGIALLATGLITPYCAKTIDIKTADESIEGAEQDKPFLDYLVEEMQYKHGCVGFYVSSDDELSTHFELKLKARFDYFNRCSEEGVLERRPIDSAVTTSNPIKDPEINRLVVFAYKEKAKNE